jgi:hypothetical protein
MRVKKMNNIDIYLELIDHKETLDFQLKQMENEATTLVIHLSEEFIVDEYSYVMVFKLNNNAPIVSAPLTPVDDIISIVIYNPLTYQNGYLKCELQAYESEVLVKSKTFALEVLETIQGEPQPIPSVYPPLYNYYDYNASDFGVIDLGNYFDSDTIEDVLQEIAGDITIVFEDIEVIENDVTNLETKTRGIYDDLPPCPLLTARTGATPPSLTTFKGNIPQYTFNVNTNESFGSTEMTHQYKEGTDILAHIHWASNGVDTTDRYVKWELEYSISRGTDIFENVVVISSETMIPANAPTTSYFITSLGTISGIGVKIGDYICWRLRRITSTGTAPTNNPFGIAVGFHVEQDSFGSTTVYSK